ncbi:MAG: CDP-diacylglycerol--glycerol-3-phosphate 3-phosphatidyltransferase [Actinomycetota bacterium]|nr:CDP-diacylglycerol--glycerol-3-phosphate 3-phosphatidyltransferase [Actinomycetota bacterium]
MNLPNWITVGRVALIPVFLYLAYEGTDRYAVAALAVFLLASASDMLDGYLARRDDRVSRLGQFLDPLADKLLVGAALIVLVDLRALPLWAALLIAFREIAVQILRTQIVSGGGSLPASGAAKAKTALQIVMVSWWLLPLEAGPLHWLLLAAALVSTYWSGAEYFAKARHPEEVVP